MLPVMDTKSNKKERFAKFNSFGCFVLKINKDVMSNAMSPEIRGFSGLIIKCNEYPLSGLCYLLCCHFFSSL